MMSRILISLLSLLSIWVACFAFSAASSTVSFVLWIWAVGSVCVWLEPGEPGPLPDEETPLFAPSTALHRRKTSFNTRFLMLSFGVVHIVLIWRNDFNESNAPLLASSFVAAFFALLRQIISHHIVEAVILLAVYWSQFYLVASDSVIASVLILNTLVALHIQFNVLCRSLRSFANPGSYDSAGVLSYYTFWYMKPTLDTANEKGELSVDDLPNLSLEDDPALLESRFLDWWTKNREHTTPFSILAATVYRIQSKVFLKSYLHGILFLLCMFMDPILLNRLLSSEKESYSQSLLLISGLSMSMLIRVSCMEVCYFESTRVANNVRTALSQAIFRKSVRNSKHSTLNAGMLSNLMATDADKLGQFSWGVFALAQWTFAIISMPFVIYFLHSLVGNGAFLGIGMLIPAWLVNDSIGDLMTKSQKKLQEYRDTRSKIIKQLICSIKVIKVECLHGVWYDRLDEARTNELRQIRWVQYLGALNNLVGAFFSLSVPLSMFSWVILVDGKELTAAIAFSALAWISQMQWTLTSLPFLFNAWSSLKPSLERIQNFLKTSNETEIANTNSCNNPSHELGQLYLKCNSTGLSAEVSLKRGEFVVIIGPSGCGKSRLLSAFISPGDEDQICIHGTSALVKQSPFLLNASIKENILFGLPCDNVHLKDCLERTDLLQDLASLPNGILTMVGPSGVQLSGGQKARVTLARALYSNADCFILDDILSAVDRRTGVRIWENVLLYLKRKQKAILLVTHQMQFLKDPEIDNVLVMSNGKILAAGKFDDLASSDHVSRCLEFLSLEHRKESPSKDKKYSSVEPKNKLVSPPLHEIRHHLESVLKSLEGKKISSSLMSRILSSFQDADSEDLSTVERSQQGSVSLVDFKFYLDHFGTLRGSIGCLVFISLVATCTSMMSTIWISVWTEASGKEGALTQIVYLAIYGCIGFLQAVVSTVQSIVLALSALRASGTIHIDMSKKLLALPLSYFDSHSTGFILNRFLQDLSNIDSSVPQTILDQIGKSFSILSQFSLIVYFTPYIFLVLPFVIALYSYIVRTFRVAARDTRRLESVARSPVYDLFNDVLNGLETIKCFAAEDRFELWHRANISKMAKAKVGNEAVNKWAQALVVQVSCVFYFFAGFMGLVLLYRDVIPVSMFGLVLLNAAVLQRVLMDFVMGLTTIESNFVSVERISDFVRTANEDEGFLNAPEGWPATGKFELQNVRLRYAINRYEALRGISLSIDSGSKIAVIGRTGCGKSSLLGALSVLYPISSGIITLDGINITSVHRKFLRKAIKLMPQDVVLFDMSIRDNIALGREIDDATIWSTLETVSLSKCVKVLGGLDHIIKIGESENFSAGEKQMLCLARALVCNKPKILLCDEATSNVDILKDDQVLNVLLELPMSVVMVMHRLENLHRFDKILLMDNGEVTAFGDARSLLTNNDLVKKFVCI